MFASTTTRFFLGAAAMAALGACGGGGAQDYVLADTADEVVSSHVDNANVAIPDNTPAGVSRAITFDHGFDVAQSVRVNVRISHPYRGDLRVVLRAPGGTEAVLHDQTGGSADNLRINRLVPALNGQRVSGDWILVASDHDRLDVGRLISWSLDVDHVTGPSPCESTSCEAGTHCELQQVQCIRAPCLPVPACVPDAVVDPCITASCAPGTHCEAVPVTCIRAPCPVLAQCVPDPTCQPSDCTGPAPRAPTVQCSDGSVGGPVCEIAADGLCGWSIRQCPPERQFCGSRGQQVYCGEGEYCHREPAQICGRADAPGQCRALPTVCPRLYLPVCGCNAQTYGNACQANAAGVSVDHEGACGAWDEKGADFGSSNPYRNNQRLENTFFAPPDATRLRLSFDRFSTESGYDFVVVYDANGAELARESGELGVHELVVDLPIGTNARVVFSSDASVVKAGFHIPAIAWWRVTP